MKIVTTTKQSPLSITDRVVYSALAYGPSGSHLGISRATGLDRGTVKRAVNRLEALGLVADGKALPPQPDHGMAKKVDPKGREFLAYTKVDLPAPEGTSVVGAVLQATTASLASKGQAVSVKGLARVAGVDYRTARRHMPKPPPQPVQDGPPSPVQAVAGPALASEGPGADGTIGAVAIEVPPVPPVAASSGQVVAVLEIDRGKPDHPDGPTIQVELGTDLLERDRADVRADTSLTWVHRDWHFYVDRFCFEPDQAARIMAAILAGRIDSDKFFDWFLKCNQVHAWNLEHGHLRKQLPTAHYVWRKLEKSNFCLTPRMVQEENYFWRTRKTRDGSQVEDDDEDE